MADRYEYRVTSKWCGFFGGWGSENDIAKHLETQAGYGYRLVSTKTVIGLWFWLIPRPKTLFIYERVDYHASTPAPPGR